MTTICIDIVTTRGCMQRLTRCVVENVDTDMTMDMTENDVDLAAEEGFCCISFLCILLHLVFCADIKKK